MDKGLPLLPDSGQEPRERAPCSSTSSEFGKKI